MQIPKFLRNTGYITEGGQMSQEAQEAQEARHASATRDRVLVTGATGYAAGHCIGDLLAHGYDVRGTVRNIKATDISHLRPAIEQASGAFELAEANLNADDGWAEAVDGCDY